MVMMVFKIIYLLLLLSATMECKGHTNNGIFISNSRVKGPVATVTDDSGFHQTLSQSSDSLYSGQQNSRQGSAPIYQDSTSGLRPPQRLNPVYSASTFSETNGRPYGTQGQPNSGAQQIYGESSDSFNNGQQNSAQGSAPIYQDTTSRLHPSQRFSPVYPASNFGKTNGRPYGTQGPSNSGVPQIYGESSDSFNNGQQTSGQGSGPIYQDSTSRLHPSQRFSPLYPASNFGEPNSRPYGTRGQSSTNHNSIIISNSQVDGPVMIHNRVGQRGYPGTSGDPNPTRNTVMFVGSTPSRVAVSSTGTTGGQQNSVVVSGPIRPEPGSQFYVSQTSRDATYGGSASNGSNTLFYSST